MEVQPITKREIAADIFIDKSTVIYGKTSSGKSTLIKDIMKQLSSEIDQCIVICPKISCQAYDEMVGQVFVHHSPSNELFTNILQRQEALRAIYLSVNNVDNLKALFVMVATPVEKEKWKKICQCETRTDVKNETKAKIATLKNKFLKNVIRTNSKRLEKMDLPQNLRTVLEFLDLNPRLLLIIDDCTEMLDDLKKCQAFLALFTKGRHYFTSLLFAIHSDKPLRPESRKGVMNNIFTDAKSASAYFERGSNDFGRREKRALMSHIDAIFNRGPNNFEKLFYDATNDRCHEILATIQPDFKFGHTAVRELNNRLAKNPNALDLSNPFLKNMLSKVKRSDTTTGRGSQ